MWIEIQIYFIIFLTSMSQPARAVWIEIRKEKGNSMDGRRHSLRGLCGLKLEELQELGPKAASQPARAVWIEILDFHFQQLMLNQSQPARAVWIEIFSAFTCSSRPVSHSLRGLYGLKF